MSIRPRLQTYALHGLRVRSEIDLGLAAGANGRIDLTIRWGPPLIHPRREPPEPPFARYRQDDRTWYTHHLTRSRVELWYPDVCAAHLDTTLCRMVVRLAPGGNAALVPLIVGGNALASVLLLTGACALHASAVEVDGRAVAFLGPSGAGKSTLATLACGAGARLVADDLLRVDVNADPPRCHTGPPTTRLRPGSAALATQLPGARLGRAGDGRILVPMPSSEQAIVALGAIVRPIVVRGQRKIALRRLTSAEALVTLMRFPRVAGVEAFGLVRTQFTACAEIARRVPTYEAQLPWNPAMTPGMLRQLLDAVAHRRAAAGTVT